jgi:hypothetical protein
VPADLAPLAPPEPPSRHPWAWLLRRVFAADVTTCPVEGCEGRMRVLEIATAPDDLACVLADAGARRSRAPPRPGPRHGVSPRPPSPELRLRAVPCTAPSSNAGAAPNHEPSTALQVW